jgi:nucleoside-diphosphate-sugar epimerase
MKETSHFVITGGAGYIGSVLTSRLLEQGHYVTVVDNLLYGGESLLAFLGFPNFRFVKADVCEPRAIRTAIQSDLQMPHAIIHLAGINGFPACQAVGRQVAWRYNVEATQHVFEQANELGIPRFVFISSCSNYASDPDGQPANEDKPLNPQTLFGETQVAAEIYLLSHSDAACAPLIFRVASLYGLSPRMRFDLLLHQFVLDAFSKREISINQRGYQRSFLNVSDAVEGIMLGFAAEEGYVRGVVYNLGSQNGNYTKDQLAEQVLKRLPETVLVYKDITFGGDMRDQNVSFQKIQTELGFQANQNVEDGIREVLNALRSGMFNDPNLKKHWNAQFVVH